MVISIPCGNVIFLGSQSWKATSMYDMQDSKLSAIAFIHVTSHSPAQEMRQKTVLHCGACAQQMAPVSCDKFTSYRLMATKSSAPEHCHIPLMPCKAGSNADGEAEPVTAPFFAMATAMPYGCVDTATVTATSSTLNLHQ